ncbi:helix-turn-helix domain-containing protein [Nocardiopsis metallicus]|uniref:Excisionase family DNA binding protein n=1 Tax=Nocardiopsis metallicus TaxID=179819 RepID=A0A840WCR8_9ACTN|nr:helix-turn-helix domain-containing protein [Nocardiopsis metallicus]MBB5493934.1 excisionase family DNA binding protein [Nocardiopsis metallicus]
MRAATARKPKAVKVKHVEIRETFMRYRVMVTRVQVAERYVRATDEEDAAKKVQEEFDRPYGYFGSWKTASSEVEVVGAEETAVIKQPHPLSPEGPLLLSLKEAGKALGLSYSTVYELVNRGEIEHVMVGSRKYISRDALTYFISQNTHRGYHR